MPRAIYLSAFVVLIILLVLPGCQDAPTVPDSSADSNSSAVTSGDAGQSHQCFGYYTLIINTDAMEVDATPLRSSEWHFNLTGILNTTMGVSAAGVPSEHDPANGLFVFDITLSHPFETSPQLAGFDVKGILVTPGTYAVGSLIFSGADETRLENADGYTRWWNPTEFTSPGMLGYEDGILASAPGSSLTATVNPYKYFADILYPISSLGAVCYEPLDSDQGRGVFTAGSNNTRRYEIRFPMDPGPQIVYGYAIDCSWNPPSPNPPTEVPDDFPMNANQPEAYRIGIKTTANTLYYDSESGIGGGVLRLEAGIFDWQGQAAGNIPPELSTVRFVAPDLMSSGVDGILHEQTPEKAVYTVDLTGVAVPTEAGGTLVVCRVASSDGSTYKQTAMPAPDDSLSAYNVIALDIPDPECTADTNNQFNEAFDLDLNEPTIDQMCAPDDYKDFFEFDIPWGNLVAGEMTLYCDAEPTDFGLYDDSEALISEVAVSGGVASIDFGALGIMLGHFYLRVLTQTSGHAFIYMIEPNIELEDVTPLDPVNVTPDGLCFNPTWVTAYGQLAFASGKNGLWVYDYGADKFDPPLLSHVEINIGQKPALVHPYIYLVDSFSTLNISMIDMTDPSNPVLHKDIMLAGGAVNCLQAEPDYLYLGLETSNIDIYDIATDPTAPVLVATIPHYKPPQEMELLYNAYGPDYWLVVSENYLMVNFYNVTDKSAIPAPGIISYLSGTSIRDITTIDNYCFHVMYDSGANNYFVSTYIDANGLVSKDSDSLVYSPNLVDVEGDFGFVANDLHIMKMDISNPNDPVHVANYTLDDAKMLDMDIEGQYAWYALGEAGLRMIGFPGLNDFGRTIGLGDPSELAIDGDYMFATESADPYYAIKSVDISDPANAFIADELILGYWPSRIEVNGDKLIAAVNGQYFMTVDSSDPSLLVGMDVYDTAKWVLSIGLTDTALYIGHLDWTFGVWDISNWSLPSYVKSIAVTELAKQFLFKDNIMYARSGGDILVYSINNPLDPNYIDTYTALASVTNMTIDGDYLYMATEDTLEIADISNPQTPTFVASEPHPDAPHGQYIAVENQFAILQPYWTTPPAVMRVWPLDDPTVIGPLYGSEYAVKPNQVLIHDGYYYELDPDFIVRIWDLY